MAAAWTLVQLTALLLLPGLPLALWIRPRLGLGEQGRVIAVVALAGAATLAFVPPVVFLAGLALPLSTRLLTIGACALLAAIGGLLLAVRPWRDDGEG